MSEKKQIPEALKYSIDTKGDVTNNKSNTPVFHKDGKVRLYDNTGTRKEFSIAKLLEKLFNVKLKEEAKEVKKASKTVAENIVKTKKEVVAEKPKRGSVIKEIQALLEKGKTREQIWALNKYNKNTVSAQWYFKKAADEKK